jgi:hypothetical protein
VTYGAVRILTVIITVSALFSSSTAMAQEMFRRLADKEIQAKVIGNDIVDSSQCPCTFDPMAL